MQRPDSGEVPVTRSRFHARLSWTGVLAIALLLPPDAGAVLPRHLEYSSFEDFAAGKARGVAIDSEGVLRATPALVRIAGLDAERIWALAAGPGGVLYAGTGDGGRVVRVRESGEAELLFDSPEIAVHSALPDRRGNLTVGTSPGGLVYRLDGDGAPVLTAETGSRYVWDLAFDEKGRVLAALGEPGGVIRVRTDGRLDTLWNSSERHVMALLRSGGRLFAATAGPRQNAEENGGEADGGDGVHAGRLYEIGPEPGRHRLVCETPFDEINRIAAAAEGKLLISALSERPGTDEEKTRAAVLLVHETGALTTLWQTDAPIFDLQPETGGSFLAAAGGEGQLVRLFPDRGEFEVVARLDSLSPNRLLANQQGVFVGAAQSGDIWKLSPQFAEEGEFLSRVEDLELNSRWGRIEWDAEVPQGTGLSVQTRSGNSAEPDPTWSEWSAELRVGAAIPSPPARYLQYRLLLRTGADATPEVRRVAFRAQQTNLAPRILELQTYPFRPRQSGGNGSGDQGAVRAVNQGPDPRRHTQRKSLRMVRWQARDPNGDKLAYDIFLRGDGQSEWKLVKENTPRNSLLWDTEHMPEGRTQLKLVASDRPDNPVENALQHERISDPFLLDNSPPVIELRTVGRGTPEVEVEITDRVSEIRRAQYSIDYGETVYQIEPADGMFDSLRESARFTLENLDPGEHVIAVQAWDRLDNIGSRQVIVNLE